MYTTIVWRDELTTGGSVYIARHPELPGCFAQGDTPEQARRLLNDVRADYLDHLRATGQPVPVPGATWPRMAFDCGGLG